MVKDRPRRTRIRVAEAIIDMVLTMFVGLLRLQTALTSNGVGMRLLWSGLVLTGSALAILFVSTELGRPVRGEAPENETSALLKQQQKAGKSIFLRCEGREQTEIMMESGSVTDVQKAMYVFRIVPDQKKIERAAAGSLNTICRQEPCLEVGQNHFKVNEPYERSDSSGTELGITQLFFDRVTGSLEAYSLIRQGTGTGDEDLIVARQTSFSGTCDRIESLGALKPKF